MRHRRHRRHGHLFQNRYKSVLCEEDPYLLELVHYINWGTRELGMSAIGISKKMNIAPSTVSECVTRGRKIVDEKGLKLLDDGIKSEGGLR